MNNIYSSSYSAVSAQRRLQLLQLGAKQKKAAASALLRRTCCRWCRGKKKQLLQLLQRY
jgi:hypothetical protein